MGIWGDVIEELNQSVLDVFGETITITPVSGEPYEITAEIVDTNDEAVFEDGETIGIQVIFLKTTTQIAASLKKGDVVKDTYIIYGPPIMDDRWARFRLKVKS